MGSAAASAVAAILVVATPGSRAEAQPFAYVASRGIGGAVSVINIQTNAVVATISLPPVGPSTNVAVSPDGHRVYASNDSLLDAVSVIDTATNNILVPAILVGNGPRGIAVSPDSHFVYVANQFSSSVSVIDRASNSTIATIPVGFEPTGIGVTPDGSRVYVADSVLDVVWVIDAATNTSTGGSIPVGGNPQDLLMSRDGSTVYVSNFNSQSVSVIDTASNTVHATIPVGFFPLGMDTSLDGKYLYVVDDDPALNNGSVAVVDTATNTVRTRVNLPPFHTARHVAITPDGAHGYVTINLPQQVLVFDTASNVVVGNPIIVDGIPEGIAITPTPAVSTTSFAKLESSLNVRPNSRYPFSAIGSFVLGQRSDGIQPESEFVRISIAGSSGVLFDEALAAGSFEHIGHGGAIFHADSRDGAIQLMRITAARVGGAYGFEMLGGTAGVGALPESGVTLSLQIGNDAGSVELKCTRRGSWMCQ